MFYCAEAISILVVVFIVRMLMNACVRNISEVYVCNEYDMKVRSNNRLEVMAIDHCSILVSYQSRNAYTKLEKLGRQVDQLQVYPTPVFPAKFRNDPSVFSEKRSRWTLYTSGTVLINSAHITDYNSSENHVKIYCHHFLSVIWWLSVRQGLINVKTICVSNLFKKKKCLHSLTLKNHIIVSKKIYILI